MLHAVEKTKIHNKNKRNNYWQKKLKIRIDIQVLQQINESKMRNKTAHPYSSDQLRGFYTKQSSFGDCKLE